MRVSEHSELVVNDLLAVSFCVDRDAVQVWSKVTRHPLYRGQIGARGSLVFRSTWILSRHCLIQGDLSRDLL